MPQYTLVKQLPLAVYNIRRKQLSVIVAYTDESTAPYPAAAGCQPLAAVLVAPVGSSCAVPVVFPALHTVLHLHGLPMHGSCG